MTNRRHLELYKENNTDRVGLKLTRINGYHDGKVGSLRTLSKMIEDLVDKTKLIDSPLVGQKTNHTFDLMLGTKLKSLFATVTQTRFGRQKLLTRINLESICGLSSVN